MSSTKRKQRHEEILRFLSAVPIATVSNIAELLDVSTETIRKDIKILSGKGLVMKVHGGVSSSNGFQGNTPYDYRTSLNIIKKTQIATAACSLIEKEEVIILESSTTTVELTKALLKKSDLLRTLTVITNSFRIAEILEQKRSCNRLFFLGGWVNHSEHSVSGTYTSNSLNDFHVDKCFLSAAALSNDFVLSGFYDSDAAFQKQAIKSAKKCVLMCDSSKFGKASTLPIIPLSEINYLVTDKTFRTEEEEKITAGGTRIIHVSVK